MAAHLDAWDYTAAAIPSALTEEMEAHQEARAVRRLALFVLFCTIYILPCEYISAAEWGALLLLEHTSRSFRKTASNPSKAERTGSRLCSGFCRGRSRPTCCAVSHADRRRRRRSSGRGKRSARRLRWRGAPNRRRRRRPPPSRRWRLLPPPPPAPPRGAWHLPDWHGESAIWLASTTC